MRILNVVVTNDTSCEVCSYPLTEEDNLDKLQAIVTKAEAKFASEVRKAITGDISDEDMESYLEDWAYYGNLEDGSQFDVVLTWSTMGEI